MDLSLNKDVPPSLRSTMHQLRDAGFEAVVSGGPVHSHPKNPYGLSVRVRAEDPRFAWGRHKVNTTPFVAGLSPMASQLVAPVGFSFNILDNGDFMLHSGPVESAYEATTFAKQFTSPVGPEGKIANVRRPDGDSINAGVALNALARLRKSPPAASQHRQAGPGAPR